MTQTKTLASLEGLLQHWWQCWGSYNSRTLRTTSKQLHILVNLCLIHHSVAALSTMKREHTESCNFQEFFDSYADYFPSIANHLSKMEMFAILFLRKRNKAPLRGMMLVSVLWGKKNKQKHSLFSLRKLNLWMVLMCRKSRQTIPGLDFEGFRWINHI